MHEYHKKQRENRHFKEEIGKPHVVNNPNVDVSDDTKWVVACVCPSR
jgi:hypothetical protein